MLASLAVVPPSTLIPFLRPQPQQPRTYPIYGKAVASVVPSPGFQSRIALKVTIFHDDVPQVMAVVAHEAVAPFVEGVAVLAGTGRGLIFGWGRRIETEVHAGKIEGRAS